MKPNLRWHPLTGEIQEPACSHIAGCQHCSDREDAFDVLQRKLTGAMAEIGRLKKDADAEARRHELWAEALTVHEWWALATGHFKASFSADAFYIVQPRLKARDGLLGVLRAIAGAAYDPMTRMMKNGKLERYDSFELINRSAEKQASFQMRAPGPDSEHEWKRWLIARIESNLR